jgi:cell division protease FtsH
MQFSCILRGLFAWSLIHYLETNGWIIIRVLNYRNEDPKFEGISVDCDNTESLPVDARLLIEKNQIHLMVAVEFDRNSAFYVESNPKDTEVAEIFVKEVKSFSHTHNFYRGKKIELGYPPRFLKLNGESWDSVILEPEVKREIKANTIDFLKRVDILKTYGIPTRRGILLSGEPGTGKTLICKSLMAEALGITCITSTADHLEMGFCDSDLFAMADDLSPSIVFIEDIDIVGKKRDEFGGRDTALVSLLNAMDGFEEHGAIVTIATTNYVDLLDKALKERPSRFDRVITLALPKLEQRKELIDLHQSQIPLSEETKNYIARGTAGLTPAQLHELIYSLVI